MSGHVHITPLGGIAGDMFVAGMLDAFPEFTDAVLDATRAVLPGRAASLAPVAKAGMAARSFVVPDQDQSAPIHYPEFDSMMAAADLPRDARHHARAMLRRLAEAEAAVHGVPLEKVHFHEIADWDTLADLTAAGVLIALLDGWSWSFDPLPLGAGTIRTAHGRLPVPAPATARLLQGLAVQDDGIPGERVTPTGAAIMRHISTALPLRARPMGRLRATGHGAGTRDLPGLPNVVVVQVIEGAAQDKDTVAVLEWDVDDMTGEEIAVAADHLRAREGVLDVVTIPLTGKKGRPCTGFRVLAVPARADEIAQAVFAQTSTLGLRVRQDQRLVLPREIVPGGKRALRALAETVKADSDGLAILPTLEERRAKAREVEQ
ncbi:MAG: LarC family nickel insertion protein [Roseovarius sp.]